MNDQNTIFEASSIRNIPEGILQKLDAIFILGGGVPLKFDEPPDYVQQRCDIAAELYIYLQKHALQDTTKKRVLPKILTLSAGTAHMPQLLSADNSPICESTVSAAYIMKNYKDISVSHIFVETTSYDTISNAFFARTNFTDVVDWRNILIVTSEFHMIRSKVIFDWVFGAKNIHHDVTVNNKKDPYNLYYLSTDNIGMTDDVLKARQRHEIRRTNNITEHLSKKYSTLQDIFEFITTCHDFYCTEKLVKRATDVKDSPYTMRTPLLELSYGYRQKKAVRESSSSFMVCIVFILTAIFAEYVFNKI